MVVAVPSEWVVVESLKLLIFQSKSYRRDNTDRIYHPHPHFSLSFASKNQFRKEPFHQILPS